uniref:EF-hand domain-containing protein n=2 Tax=Hemiselmis andersenii TaxID=464988 RepID=A0A6T8PRD5_HEMAN|mmetsp:Transcript_545/g.1324  ORF Transcript_545/g.1324 Transcript_545/m.1324 type:complete len:444 (-) Transcript_545:23-1354(-)
MGRRPSIVAAKNESLGPAQPRANRPGPEYYAKISHSKLMPMEENAWSDAEIHKAHVAKERRMYEKHLAEREDPHSRTSQCTQMASTTVRRLPVQEAQDYVFKRRKEQMDVAMTRMMKKVEKGMTHSSEESMESWWALWSPQIEIHGNFAQIAASVNPDAVHVAELKWLPPGRRWLDPRQQVLKTKAMHNILSEDWTDASQLGKKPPKMKIHQYGGFVPIKQDTRSGVREETMSILNRAFQELDVDENGELQVAELRAILDRLGFGLSRQEFDKLVSDIDKDRTGTIDFGEFKNAFPTFMRMKNEAAKNEEQRNKLLAEKEKKQQAKKQRWKLDPHEKNFRAATPPQRRSFSSLLVVPSDQERARWEVRPKTVAIPRRDIMTGLSDTSTIRQLLNKDYRDGALMGAKATLAPTIRQHLEANPRAGRLPSRSTVLRHQPGRSFKF